MKGTGRLLGDQSAGPRAFCDPRVGGGMTGPQGEGGQVRPGLLQGPAGTWGQGGPPGQLGLQGAVIQQVEGRCRPWLPAGALAWALGKGQGLVSGDRVAFADAQLSSRVCHSPGASRVDRVVFHRGCCLSVFRASFIATDGVKLSSGKSHSGLGSPACCAVPCSPSSQLRGSLGNTLVLCPRGLAPATVLPCAPRSEPRLRGTGDIVVTWGRAERGGRLCSCPSVADPSGSVCSGLWQEVAQPPEQRERGWLAHVAWSWWCGSALWRVDSACPGPCADPRWGPRGTVGLALCARGCLSSPSGLGVGAAELSELPS